MVMISERPPEAADRAVPGHREGDLLIGGDCRSAVGTLVERTTRYVLLHLSLGRDACGVERAMRQAIGTLPDELWRSVTWDQGKETAHHARFTISTGIQVYFCEPHKPWQRGSNENLVTPVQMTSTGPQVAGPLTRLVMPNGMELHNARLFCRGPELHAVVGSSWYRPSINDFPFDP